MDERATVGAWVDAWVDDERPAFRFEGQQISYDELATRVRLVVGHLCRLGVRAGDRVAWCGLNRVELFEALFACARIGAIFLPLNNRLSEGELRTQITDSGPSLILTTDGFEELISHAADGRPVRDLDHEPFVGNASSDELVVTPDSADPLLMVYTSGTTGSPKGAMLSHQAIEYTARNSIDHQGFTADDCVIAPLPTFHVGGLNIQTLPVLRMGGQVILQRRFDPGGVLELIGEHRPTQTLLVPAMLQAVAAHPEFADTDLSCLVGIATGSSVVPEPVMRPYFDRGVPVGQVYGATETGPTSVALRYDEAATHMDSCGRATAHTDVRVVDTDGRDAPPGEAGEVWLRGPNLFSRYWNRPEETTEAFVDGWYRTGDVGRLDDDGYLYISDRMKDLIISGGENVYPAEVEAVLSEHPAIGELAVIGRSDERWGEVPVAYVVASGAEPAPTLEELHRWCEDKLAKFKRPHEVLLVDSLPRTALGKVQKHLLTPPDLTLPDRAE